MRNGQTEQNQGFSLNLLARRRTKVRRTAKFVCSIKHKTDAFLLMRLLQSFGLAIPLTYHVKALIFTVLYGHRFFYIPAPCLFLHLQLLLRHFCATLCVATNENIRKEN